MKVATPPSSTEAWLLGRLWFQRGVPRQGRHRDSSFLWTSAPTGYREIQTLQMTSVRGFWCWAARPSWAERCTWWRWSRRRNLVKWAAPWLSTWRSVLSRIWSASETFETYCVCLISELFPHVNFHVLYVGADLVSRTSKSVLFICRFALSLLLDLF